MAARKDEQVVRLAVAAQGEVGRINSEIGARIKAYRNQGGLTQAELGKRVGLSQQQIQKYEKGQDRVPVDKLRLICAALGIEPSVVYRVFDTVPIEPTGFAEAGAPFGDALATREATLLVRAFGRIEDKVVRKRVLDLVRALGARDKADERDD